MSSSGENRHEPGSRDWRQLRDRLARAMTALEQSERLPAERAQAILEKRAHDLAQVPPQAPRAGEIVEALIFAMGAERYAIATDYLREVLRFGDFTPLPGSPDFLIGVTNLRGQILALFDLRRIFAVNSGPPGDESRIIVLGDDRPEFGILADAVFEVARLRNDRILAAPDSVAGIARDFVRGVTEDALILLDGAVLLGDSRLHIDVRESSEAGT